MNGIVKVFLIVFGFAEFAVRAAGALVVILLLIATIIGLMFIPSVLEGTPAFVTPYLWEKL